MWLALTHTATHWRCLFLRHPVSTAAPPLVPGRLFHEIASHLPYTGFVEILKEFSECDLRYNREALVQSDRGEEDVSKPFWEQTSDRGPFWAHSTL